LKDEIIKQLVEIVPSGPMDGITAITISREFRFDDGKEPGKHTKEHAQSLSVKSVEYLLRQADNIFSEMIDEKTGAPFWRRCESDQQIQ
jgi:hypothetical protein